MNWELLSAGTWLYASVSGVIVAIALRAPRIGKRLSPVAACLFGLAAIVHLATAAGVLIAERAMLTRTGEDLQAQTVAMTNSKPEVWPSIPDMRDKTQYVSRVLLENVRPSGALYERDAWILFTLFCICTGGWLLSMWIESDQMKSEAEAEAKSAKAQADLSQRASMPPESIAGAPPAISGTVT